MTTTERLVPMEAEPYIAAVRELLWSLPTDERDELLDDLSAHLTELAAEDGAPLRQRLGAPSAYAAEFVASAGVAPSAPPARSISMPQLHLPAAVRDRLTALRPAWLVIRPFLVIFGGAELFINDFSRNAERFEVALLVLVAVAGISVSQRLTGVVDRLVTVAAVLGGLALFAAWTDGPDYVYVDNSGYQQPLFLTRADGMPITNIWAYDANGEPVDVFLFDQDGSPIVDLQSSSWDERTGEEITAQPRTGPNGAPLLNLYPRVQSRYGPYGEHRDEAPAVSTPRVESSTTSTTAVPATTTTTVAPAP
jgi:hypothetical protein